MPPTQFKEVITGPAARATEGGRRLTFHQTWWRGFSSTPPRVPTHLPMLSLTLARLYADYGSTGELTVEQYEAMGGMRRVVETEIDEVLASDPDQRRHQLDCLRAAFIPWLATVNPENDQPLRRVARYEDLPEESRPLIDALVAKRLLLKDQRDGQVVVEVALESLLRQWDELADWLREQRHELQVADDVERADTAWRSNGKDPAWLLAGSRLADAEKVVGSAAFTQRMNPVREYLDASRQSENERVAAEEERRDSELRNAQEPGKGRNARNRLTQAIANLACCLCNDGSSRGGCRWWTRLRNERTRSGARSVPPGDERATGLRCGRHLERQQAGQRRQGVIRATRRECALPEYF